MVPSGTESQLKQFFNEETGNTGSPKLQERYFDNIMLSSKPIKCNCESGGGEKEKN